MFNHFKIFSSIVLMSLLAGCAGVNKLERKHLSVSELVSLHQSSESKAKTFMASKGWENTTAEDLKKGEIDSDELSWSLRKNARSSKIASLSFYEDDWEYTTDVTYQLTSKEVYNNLISQLKSGTRKVTQCTDKAHAKSGSVHYYDSSRDYYFYPPSAERKMYYVLVTDSY